MLTALGATVAWLQESQEMKMAENKSLGLEEPDLLKKSKNASVSISANRHKKIASSFQRHALGVDMEVESKIPSLAGKDVSELEHF